MNMFDYRLAVRRSGLPYRLKAFLVLLTTWSSGRGERIWPSAPTIAEELGMNTGTARDHLRALEAAGWIKRHMRPGTSNEISFHTAEPVTQTPGKQATDPIGNPDTLENRGGGNYPTPPIGNPDRGGIGNPDTKVVNEVVNEEEREREKRVRELGEGRTHAREQQAGFSLSSSTPPVETPEEIQTEQAPPPPTPKRLRPWEDPEAPAFMRSANPVRAALAMMEKRDRRPTFAEEEARWAAMSPEEEAEELAKFLAATSNRQPARGAA